MKIKATMRSHLAPARMVIIKRQVITNVDKELITESGHVN
jgi:hypothetical protein